MVGTKYLDFSESKTWNVAEDFTQRLIFKYMVEADYYQTLAEFGCSDLLGEFSMEERAKKEARIQAVKRWISSLKRVIENSKVKAKPTEDAKLCKYLKGLKILKSVWEKSFKRVNNDATKKRETTIYEEKFDKVVEVLALTKTEVFEFLNDAGILFPKVEEFNPNKIKEAMRRKLVEVG